MTNMMNHSQAVVRLRKIVAYHPRSPIVDGYVRIAKIFLNGDERIDSHLIFSKDR